MSEVIRSDQMPVQVAWSGVQLPSVGGLIPLVLVMMMPRRLELMMIMLRTSLLYKKLGIQGPHRIEAHFDQDFSLNFFICVHLFCFVFTYFIFILISCIYDSLISAV